jgi:hypothetical protein
MAAVAQQYDLVTLAHPCWNGVSIADLPIETTRSLLHSSRNVRIQVAYQAPHLVHIPWLKPGFFDVFGIFVSEDPVEFFPASEGVLDQVHVFSYPEVDTFFTNVIATGRVILKDIAFEEGSEASVSLEKLEMQSVNSMIPTDDFGLSTNPSTFSHALDLMPNDPN